MPATRVLIIACREIIEWRNTNVVPLSGEVNDLASAYMKLGVSRHTAMRIVENMITQSAMEEIAALPLIATKKDSL